MVKGFLNGTLPGKERNQRFLKSLISLQLLLLTEVRILQGLATTKQKRLTCFRSTNTSHQASSRVRLTAKDRE